MMLPCTWVVVVAARESRIGPFRSLAFLGENLLCSLNDELSSNSRLRLVCGCYYRTAALALLLFPSHDWAAACSDSNSGGTGRCSFPSQLSARRGLSVVPSDSRTAADVPHTFSLGQKPPRASAARACTNAFNVLD